MLSRLPDRVRPPCSSLATPADADRIKDLGAFQGVRPNQLTGYGIVVGLAGTGDDNLEYATQGMNGVASRFGLTLPPGVNPALKNAAAVMITAELPAFARPGQRLDITVSAHGPAQSLRGGTLIMTPAARRRQPDLRDGAGQSRRRRPRRLGAGRLARSRSTCPPSGRIPGGATVERAVETGFATAPDLHLQPRRIRFHHRPARRRRDQPASSASRSPAPIDGVSVAIEAPQGAEIRTALMSRIENIEVEPADAPARVIVNARTGTVVINGAVRITPGRGQPRQAHRRGAGRPAGQPAARRCSQRPDRGRAIQQHRRSPSIARPMFNFAPGASLADIVRR